MCANSNTTSPNENSNEKLDWSQLYFGHITQTEIRDAAADAYWQSLRKSLKGLTLEEKYDSLAAYYEHELSHIIDKFLDHYPADFDSYTRERRMLEVRITNYVTALSRGGLIKPEDYKCKQ
jgi:hypothetical protein